MILYLIRHGESAFNVEGRIQGQLDVPLSELGRQQSLALAEAAATLPIEAIYCSPLERARQTAQPLAERLKLSVLYDAQLMELNAGVFQGLVWSEIEQRYPHEAASWRAQQGDYRIPEGESRRDLLQRAEQALQRILALPYEHVAVVSHGGALSAGLKGLLGVPVERNPFIFYNASISRLQSSAGQIKLLTLNQIEHLQRPGRELMSRMGDL